MSILDPGTGVTGTWNYVQDKGIESEALTVVVAAVLATVVGLAYVAAYLVLFVGPFVLFWEARGPRRHDKGPIASASRSHGELSCEDLRALANDMRGRALPLPAPTRRLPSPRRSREQDVP